MSIRIAVVAAAALAVTPAGSGAIAVGSAATAPALRVDAAGNAEVSWTSSTSRRTVVVAPSGNVTRGRLAAADVSEPVRGEHIPFQRVLRSAPGGWYYALQARHGELRFSRWHGVPTEVTLTATVVDGGVRLSGHATLDGERLAPATARRTLARLEVRLGSSWQRLASVRLDSEAAYARLVRRTGGRYRVVVDGPRLAPDASAVADALVLDPGR
jgi:hypothetical protein